MDRFEAHRRLETTRPGCAVSVAPPANQETDRSTNNHTDWQRKEDHGGSH